MKKRNLLILICAIIISVGLSACNFSSPINAPLRNKMIEYYSENNNYINLNGIIISVDYGLWEIDITTENSHFTGEGFVKFHVMYDIDWIDEIEIGDEISFVTAPMYFYNGHILPIVAVEKDGQTYLSFDEGKESYLQWIEKTFG